jgi:Arc/MetJ-type ribon-helix-helix transcriptional regulator
VKQLLIEIDDRSARDLERVAPAKKRKRTEFVRQAIRAALDRELDRRTERAYREAPLPGGMIADDLAGWDQHNALARPSQPRKRSRDR